MDKVEISTYIRQNNAENDETPYNFLLTIYLENQSYEICSEM
jgi:hypothetical protein